MIQAAKEYVTEMGCVRREPIYSANRFTRLVGAVEPGSVTEDHIKRYRSACLEQELSPRTIESSISDLLAVIEHAVGERPKRGKRVLARRPQPQPASMHAINAVWSELKPWMRQWVGISYWTGLRLSDSLRLQLAIEDGLEIRGCLIWKASKTGHSHAYPVPDWFRGFLAPANLPWQAVTDYVRRMVRIQITEACKAAGIDRWSPKQLRQRSITEWMSASPEASRLLHGSGLGVLDHYVDPLTILAAAAPRVKLPDCFGAATDQPDVLPLFRRLDPAGQQLILSTMERLA